MLSPHYILIILLFQLAVSGTCVLIIINLLRPLGSLKLVMLAYWLKSVALAIFVLSIWEHADDIPMLGHPMSIFWPVIVTALTLLIGDVGIFMSLGELKKERSKNAK